MLKPYNVSSIVYNNKTILRLHTSHRSLSKYVYKSKNHMRCVVQKPMMNVNFVKSNMSNNEHIKHVLLGGMCFSNLGVYTIVRDLKDVLLITSCGAEAVPFMKTWVNFPLSVLFMCFFTKLCDINLKQDRIYRIMYLSVFSTYMILGYFLYPIQGILSPFPNISLILFVYKTPLLILNNWVSALFYALSTIWGSTILTLLFWLTANNYVKKDSAKIIYPLFGFLSNISLTLCGIITRYLGDMYRNDWILNVQSLMIVVFIFGIIHMLCYEILVRNYSITNNIDFKPKKKSNVSVFESIKKVLTIPFVMYMVMLLACYGSASNLIDTVWKYNIHQYYHNPSDYSKLMGSISTYKGIFCMFTMLLSSFVLKYIPYKVTIMITPILMSLMGVIFFIMSLTTHNSYIIIIYGAIITIVTKSIKYAFFDPNKEITYMYMDDDVKTKGKATIDVLSNSVGKSGTSLILQFMILMYGSIINMIPYMMVIFTCVSIIWIRSASKIADIVTSR
jgi:ATP:ADP antiporter, AAA family